MASIIRLKRSATAGNPSTLANGELAYSSLADNGSNGGDRLYIGTGTETNGDAANHEVIGGKFFTTMLDHSKGTLTGSSAIIVDSDKKIDNLKVDNIDINLNTISTSNTDGDLVLNPNGTGVVDVSTSRITNVTNPTGAQDATTKSYVDNIQDTLAFKYQTDAGGLDRDRLINSETVFIYGDVGISTSVDSAGADDAILITLDNTAVTAGTYGTDTLIPKVTVDAQGRLTSVTTSSVKTTLTIDGDDATTGDINVRDSELSIVGAGPLSTSMVGTTMTLNIEDAQHNVKGVSKFDSAQFTLASGKVSSNDITFGTASTVTLGGSIDDIQGMTILTVDNIKLDGNTIATTDSANADMYLDPGGNDAITGRVIIRGDLQVDGTQTIINSSTLTVDDLLITLADGANVPADANGAGIEIDGADAFIKYSSTNDDFDFSHGINLDSSADFKINGVGLNELIDDRVDTLITDGEGITTTYTDASNTLEIAAETATSSNMGIAKFNTANFTVTSGDVTISEVNGGTY